MYLGSYAKNNLINDKNKLFSVYKGCEQIQKKPRWQGDLSAETSNQERSKRRKPTTILT